MTLFAHPSWVEADADDVPDAPAPVKRPSRWSVSNWPVRWKVLAIALVPMVVAVVFGGFRIAGAATDAGRLRLAADRAEMVPLITTYMSALGNALVAGSSGGDIAGATANYDNRKQDLRAAMQHTDVAADVVAGLTTLLDGGQALLDKVSSHQIGLRDQVAGFAPILLTAEDAINGSVRIDDERIRAQTQGLSRAVGARGQMTMQELLVNRGEELPGPFLRTGMITVAGTEPSTLFGMNQVLGVDSPEAKRLYQQYMARNLILADPASVLAGNADLLRSIRATDEIAGAVIEDTTGEVTKAVQDQATDRRTAAILNTVLVVAALLIALAVVVAVARSLVRPLRVLRDSALQVAHTDLEDEIARVRAGDERDPAPLPVYTTEEIGQVAHAVDELHVQALLLAGDEARLRVFVNDMFETMSRRNRSLVDQQLSLIDRLERNEEDPDRLDSLFRLDHLAARMRRNGANLLVLAGAPGSGEQGRPEPVSAVINAATSEVEDYRRVETAMMPDATVTAVAVGDTAHLLAELIDNALRYSPPTAPVQVSAAQAGDGGVLLDIVDTGLGMTDADLRVANMRLGSGGEVTPDNARHMGLFVVGRLAQRHGIGVRLLPTQSQHRNSGVTAQVYLPPDLFVGATGGAAPAEPAPVVPREQAPAGQQTPAAVALHDEPSWSQPGVGSLPRRDPGSSGITGIAAEHPRQPRPAASSPSNTAAFFSSRARAAEPAGTPAAEEEDLIYQRMLSEWLVDPHDLARSTDLDWKSVWDHGWSAAAEAESVPVAAHTEHGLPVREPGARLVPGAAGADDDGSQNGTASDGPDPDAVRASIGSHFDGVRAGRSQARHREPDQP